MPIYNYIITTSPFKGTTAYLNGLNSDANNITEEIHPQYAPAVNCKSILHQIDFIDTPSMNHIIKGLGSYPYDFIQKTSYDSVTTGILIEKLSIVKKAQNTMLNVKLDNARTSPTQSNMHVKMAVFVDGVFSTSASDYMDFPTSYSSYTSWDKQKGISTLADGALVEVYLVVVWNTGTFTGTVSAYVKNIQMYLS